MKTEPYICQLTPAQYTEAFNLAKKYLAVYEVKIAKKHHFI